ncbi:hypothetical protein CAC42_7763 [Sphaceloma murrayae]|uniref:Mediator of RNA polymerase II transcription subunit 19 n=1 Tax=Sphaceloma murrayae TaxID=2082308 RepID=A0A2K1QXL6_9PEZI|nr:hypothetical protein CAC42_7763 [Sphaceloma murrayae]
MASPERSPKRQRLSPPGDDAPLTAGTSGADSAYGSTTASQVNGITSHKGEAPTSIPGLSLGGQQTAVHGPSGSRTDDQALKVEDAEHRRTDHERQDTIPSATEDLPLLCSKPHPRSRPHPTQNLISLYGLNTLASTVARRDPATGAKINKLRKSYEGKVKKQDLPGRNKPTHIDGELMGFMEWADEAWHDQRIYGRELENALDPVKGRFWREDGEGGKGKVERAVTLAVGRLPREEDEKWRAALSLDEPAATKAPVKAPGFQGNGRLKPGLLNTAHRASAPASPMSRSAVDRPDRSGKKRRYDDASFEGYEGSWTDEAGYVSGDSRGNKGKRRREFDHPSSASQSAGASDHGHFNSSSGNKVVGVRSS